ncbi:type II secretion system GspH family protein [bacterium]|nr:type II secretion system GspH family protein [bacterium]
MKYRRSIHSFDRWPEGEQGYTLLELTVAVGLSLVVGAIALTNFQGTQRMVRYDTERTSLNQNLRSGLDILGMNVRLAGENLPGFFPAILVTDNGATDTFTIRRSILDENLVGCQDINAGTFSPIIFGDSSSTEAQCSLSNKNEVLTAWAGSRVTQGGVGLGYIYERAADVGEWFEWDSETSNANMMFITPINNAWINSYGANQAFAYVLEEWRFSLNGNTLQMVVDNDVANPINIVNGLTEFNVTIELSDGTTVDSYANGDDWSDVALVHITLSAEEQSGKEMVRRSMNGSFFPRNVLSG